MSRINEKLGLKPAGKRAFMKNLPTDRTEAAKITSAQCPTCSHTGARQSKTKGPGWLYCTWCNCVFPLSGGQ